MKEENGSVENIEISLFCELTESSPSPNRRLTERFSLVGKLPTLLPLLLLEMVEGVEEVEEIEIVELIEEERDRAGGRAIIDMANSK